MEVETMKVIAEYLWLDGKNLSDDHPDQLSDTRGKTKIFEVEGVKTIDDLKDLEKIPTWGFDGSSTMQALGESSDCVLKPVRVYPDPFRRWGEGILSIIVLNEVYKVPGDEPHPSNTRTALHKIASQLDSHKFWFAVEQEYTFMRVSDELVSTQPLAFPKDGVPKDAQGKYYCGVGADKVVGRHIVEEHLEASLFADLILAGSNAEVMPGQWEYQVGNGTSAANPLRVADDLIVSRYIMDRICEKYSVVASLHPKPVPDVDKDTPGWNGAGAHTNFSTEATRKSLAVLPKMLERLAENHEAHIKVYGNGIELRLSGNYETAFHEEFSHGVSDRGASIRIPWQVDRDGNGYLEDRRPCANIDPYVVFAKIMETTMGE